MKAPGLAAFLYLWTFLAIVFLCMGTSFQAVLFFYLLVLIPVVLIWAIIRGFMAAGQASARRREEERNRPKPPATREQNRREIERRYHENCRVIRASQLSEQSKARLLEQELKVLEDRIAQLME